MANLSHPQSKKTAPSKAKKTRASQKYSLLSQMGLHSNEVPKFSDSLFESSTVPESKYNVLLVKAQTNESNTLCISQISIPFGTLTNFGRGKLFGIFEQEIAEEQAELKVVETSSGVELQLEFKGGSPMGAKFLDSPDCVTLEKHKVYSFRHSDIFFVGLHVFKVEILRSPKTVSFGNLSRGSNFITQLQMLQQQTGASWPVKSQTKPRKKANTATTPPPSLAEGVPVQPAPKKRKGNVAPPPRPESSPSTPLTPLTSSPSSDSSVSSSSLEDLATISPCPSSDEILSSPASGTSNPDLELSEFGLAPSGSFISEPFVMWPQYPVDYQTALDCLPAPLYEGAFPFNL